MHIYMHMHMHMYISRERQLYVSTCFAAEYWCIMSAFSLQTIYLYMKLFLFSRAVTLITTRRSMATGKHCDGRYFPRYCPFVRGIDRSPVDSPHLSFDVFFDLHPNKRLSKQWWGWWFETPSFPLWRHRNGANGKNDMRYELDNIQK